MAQIPKGRSITVPGKHLIWPIWVPGLPLTTLRLGFATLRCLEKVPNIFSQMDPNGGFGDESHGRKLKKSPTKTNPSRAT